MATHRVDIDNEVMRRPAGWRPSGPDVAGFCDLNATCRTASVAWRRPGKTRGDTRVLGSAIAGRTGMSDFLSLTAARTKAA